MTSLAEAERAIRARLKGDFCAYAERCLRIRPKKGALVPLILNRVQLKLHETIRRQQHDTGRVRLIVLKGRQQGCSTYVEARFLWRVTHRYGVRAFILTHHAEATGNLFGMARRFYDNLPPMLQPEVGASSQRELYFSALDSGYKVGTAGTEGVGRSDTIQYFHGSEVAYWPHADEHAAGALQAVPDVPDTEVFLESTANGIGNFFHKQWQLAERGLSDFRPVFLPWYWQDEYQTPAPADFRPETDEIALMEAYGLTLDQLAWRRKKIAELGEEWLFRKEYPCDAAEAFQASGEDILIKPVAVAKARRREIEPYGPYVVGVDPARYGDDFTAIIRRQGRVAFGLERYKDRSVTEVAGICARILEDEPVDRMFIDVGGLGAGVFDILAESKYLRKLVPVQSGEKPIRERDFINKRTEMWAEMRDWIEGELPVQVPDDDVLHGDLCAPKYDYDHVGRLKLEKKSEMRTKRGLPSPDTGDALALTFAYPVASPPPPVPRDRYRARARADGRTWASS